MAQPPSIVTPGLEWMSDPIKQAEYYQQAIISSLQNHQNKSQQSEHNLINKFINEYISLLSKQHSIYQSLSSEYYTKFAMLLFKLGKQHDAHKIINIASKYYPHDEWLKFMNDPFDIGEDIHYTYDSEEGSEWSHDDIKQWSPSLTRSSLPSKNRYYNNPPILSYSTTTPSTIFPTKEVSTTSDNDSENDVISLTGSVGNMAIFDNDGDNVENIPNKHIYMDSVMVLDGHRVAGLLGENDSNLYLIPAVNHEIWTEFMKRTKIDEVMDNEEKTICSKNLAKKMVNNLDITDNRKMNTSIVDELVGRNKHEIKMNILLNKSKFNKIKIADLKHVGRIVFHRFYDIVPEEKRENFLDHVLSDIQWIDQDCNGKDIIITLKKFAKQSIIHKLNQRKQKYFSNNGLQNCQSLKIESFEDNRHGTVVRIGLKAFDNVIIGNRIQNVLILQSSQQQKRTKFDIKLPSDKHIKLATDTLFQQWYTHLDAIIYQQKVNDQQEQKHDDDVEDKNKYINYVTQQDQEEEKDAGLYAKHFSFGIYLNYWKDVIPVHPTLKHELLNNKIRRVKMDEYLNLYRSCLRLLKTKARNYKARHVGIDNKKMGILEGTPITINHLVSLKLYTDYTKIQREFKRYCRRYNDKESIQQIIRRISELGHWFRYLRESVQFYGEYMDKDEYLYSGFNAKLIFPSLKQHFEIPISTTPIKSVATNFCGYGIILKLKASNSKTRCLDVSWLSIHASEHEKLIMGSSLTICDILLNSGYKSMAEKGYISSLHLLDQILNGLYILHLN